MSAAVEGQAGGEGAGVAPAPSAAGGDGAPSAARSLGRRELVALGAVGAVLLVLVLVLDLLSAPVGAPGSLPVACAALAVAASAAWTARRSAGRNRRMWTCIGLAAGIGTVGGLATVLGPGADVPAGDLAGLLAVVPTTAALLALIPRRVRSERPRHLVGALVIAGGVVYLVASVAPGAVALPAGAAPLAAAAWVAYPVGQIVLVTLTLVVLSGRRPPTRPPLALLCGGVLAVAVAGTALALFPLPGSGGWVVRVALVGGLLALAAAARAPGASALFEPPAQPDFERPGSARSLAVYVPLLTTVVIVSGLTPHAGHPVLRVTEVVTLLLFGLRQALIARESAVLHSQVEARVEELRHTSASLARLAQQNTRTIEAVSEGIFGVDPDGRLTFANAAAVAMLGRGSAEMAGVNPAQLFVARRVDRHGRATANPVAMALRTGRPSGPQSAVFTRRDGSEFPVEWTAGPVAGDDGGTAGAVVVFRDITRRREVERMKDEFVSVLNHELRTPLTSIRGTLGLLAGGAVGPLTERAHSLVEHGLESAERLTRLVSDLLDVDRLESGGAPMEFAEYEAGELVRTAADGVRTLAAAVPVELRVDDVHGWVLADADRIVQTLTNLLGNAIKFSPPGTTISVTAAPRRGFVEFVVTDQGRGIPPDRIERIFERFEQIDSSDSRLQGGTGLGLAISRSIVRRHGGEIWVDSRLGSGSSFHFTIPAAGPASAGPPAPNEGTAAASTGASRFAALPLLAAGAHGQRRGAGSPAEVVGAE
jgi:PAS domain S-box-containing protein